MATSTTSPIVLVIGLKQGPGFDAATIQRFAAEQTAKVKEAGIDINGLILDPHAPHEALLEQVHAKLEEQPRWDGVVIGFGIRGDGALTILFERIVNMCVQEFKISRFGFNSTPGDTAEAVIRGFSTT